MNADTIYALSSGAGRAAVAVIRVSGPATRFGLETLCGSLPPPRRAAVRALRSGGRLLDKALVLWLPGPGSFTGEDMAEIQCHGGRAVVAVVLAALAGLGWRAAGPGEFTRRALLNDKLTLPEIEGLADLLEAETAAQQRQAIAQADGALTRAAAQWKESIVRAMALVEAQLDFADEGDVVSSGALEGIESAVKAIRADLQAACNSGRRGARLREGLTVVLAGPVNVGKSSLMNALAGRDVAIVTDVPGTTRDVLEVTLDLEGVPVTLVDTAGLRDTGDPVEREGIRRAVLRAERADLVLVLHDTPHAPASVPSNAWAVRTKVDSDPYRPSPRIGLGISTTTGEGLDVLTTALTDWATSMTGTEPALTTRERHVSCLEQAMGHLDHGLAAVAGEQLELVAEDLRLSARALDTLVGRVDVEKVLDIVFSSFCIGK